VVAAAAADAAAAAASAAVPACPSGAAPHTLPFALTVLEVLLSSAATHARGRLTRLCAATDAALGDISAATTLRGGGGGGGASSSASASAPSGEAFARLVPLTRALAALASDVAEITEALQALTQDEDALRALARAPLGSDAAADDDQDGRARHGGARDVTAVVDTYLRQVRAVDGELRELRQHIAATREVWELQLDGTRNRLHRLELYTNFAVLSLAVVSVPAALLGMNVPTGLESNPDAFPAVVTGAALAGGAAFAAGARWARAAGPAGRAAAQQGAAAARAMAAVLASLDDIEDALRAAGGGLSRPQLLAALRAACPGRFDDDISAELALMFRIFDADADGRLTLAEWAPRAGGSSGGGGSEAMVAAAAAARREQD
jgi:hypothetical protein